MSPSALLTGSPAPVTADRLVVRPRSRTVTGVARERIAEEHIVVGGVRRRVLLVGVLVLGLMAVFAVWSTRSRPVAAGVVSSRLESCVETQVTGPEAFLSEGALSECLARTLVLAHEADLLREGVSAMFALLEAEPRLHDVCHLASHQAGREIAFRADVPALLREFPDMLCSWGLGHGFLEGFALSERSPSEWRSLGRACDDFAELTGDLSAPLALCADGFGHAVWDATGDFYRSLSSCQELAVDATVSSCAAGVMMQRFRPADGVVSRFLSGSFSAAGAAAPTTAAVLVANEVVDACAQLTGFDVPVVTGCVNGAGYVLAVELISEVSALDFATLSGVIAEDDSRRVRAVEAVTSGVARMWEACSRLADVGSGLSSEFSLPGLCLSGLSPYLPRSWADGSPVNASAFCRGVPSEHQAVCADG